jgi:NTP pyrophosphatase (non-canonical NTP hydrolase)
MKISEAQLIVDEWIKKYGVRYFNELTNTAILMEEVGEVARIMARRYGEQSEKESDKQIKLEDELADVLFVLISIANQTGIILEGALKKNLDKKTNRESTRHLNTEKLTYFFALSKNYWDLKKHSNTTLPFVFYFRVDINTDLLFHLS